MPRIVLRAEGGTIFGVALLLYAITGASWGLMLALFLAPDLSLLAYLAGPRAGSIGYNLTHTLIAPALLIAVGLLWFMVTLPPFVLRLRLADLSVLR